MIDLFFRCFSRARWIAVATSRNILNAQGLPMPGYAVDELGFVVVTPGTSNPNGTVLTPPVMDTWWTVNLRIHGAAQQTTDDDTLYPGEVATGFKFIRSKLVRFVRGQSTTVMLRGMRTYQFGAAANRVQLIDSRDMTAPPRVWAGGMSL